MVELVDVRLEDVKVGELIFPSSHSLNKPGGGGYVTWDNEPIPDSKLFPAILLDIRNMAAVVLSPGGVLKISPWCLVSREKRV
jgi:hypothetical protein